MRCCNMQCCNNSVEYRIELVQQFLFPSSDFCRNFFDDESINELLHWSALAEQRRMLSWCESVSEFLILVFLLYKICSILHVLKKTGVLVTLILKAQEFSVTSRNFTRCGSTNRRAGQCRKAVSLAKQRCFAVRTPYHISFYGFTLLEVLCPNYHARSPSPH